MTCNLQLVSVKLRQLNMFCRSQLPFIFSHSVVQKTDVTNSIHCFSQRETTGVTHLVVFTNHHRLEGGAADTTSLSVSPQLPWFFPRSVRTRSTLYASVPGPAAPASCLAFFFFWKIGEKHINDESWSVILHIIHVLGIKSWVVGSIQWNFHLH